MVQIARHMYNLVDNIKSKMDSKRLSYLRGMMCLFLVIMINVQITTLIQDEGTAMKEYNIHKSSSKMSSSSHDLTGMDAVRSGNETLEFKGIQNAEWCVGKCNTTISTNT